MEMELEFAGDTQLIDALENVAGPVAEEAMRVGVRAGSKVIAEAMREAAPVLDEKTANSNALEPGALRHDIRIYHPRNQEAGRIEEIIGPGDDTEHVANWVEWGHRLIKGGYSKLLPNGYRRGPGHEVGTVRPHPFLRPAYEQSAQRALEACEKAAAELLGKGLK